MSKDIKLTVQELVLLDYCLQGKTQAQMALDLGVVERTISNRLSRIQRKLGVDTIIKAVAMAVKFDLLEIKEVNAGSSQDVSAGVSKFAPTADEVYKQLARRIGKNE